MSFHFEVEASPALERRIVKQISEPLSNEVLQELRAGEQLLKAKPILPSKRHCTDKPWLVGAGLILLTDMVLCLTWLSSTGSIQGARMLVLQEDSQIINRLTDLSRGRRMDSPDESEVMIEPVLDQSENEQEIPDRRVRLTQFAWSMLEATLFCAIVIVMSPICSSGILVAALATAATFQAGRSFKNPQISIWRQSFLLLAGALGLIFIGAGTSFFSVNIVVGCLMLIAIVGIALFRLVFPAWKRSALPLKDVFLQESTAFLQMVISSKERGIAAFMIVAMVVSAVMVPTMLLTFMVADLAYEEGGGTAIAVFTYVVMKVAYTSKLAYNAAFAACAQNWAIIIQTGKKCGVHRHVFTGLIFSAGTLIKGTAYASQLGPIGAFIFSHLGQYSDCIKKKPNGKTPYRFAIVQSLLRGTPLEDSSKIVNFIEAITEQLPEDQHFVAACSILGASIGFGLANTVGFVIGTPLLAATVNALLGAWAGLVGGSALLGACRAAEMSEMPADSDDEINLVMDGVSD